MRPHLALLLLSCLIAACGSDSPTSSGGAPLPFETLVQSSVSGFSNAERRLVAGPAEWDQVWQVLHAGLDPVPAVPVVDFERESVLLVAAGSRSNGCYAIGITRASVASSGAAELEVTETVPGAACVCLQYETRPVHVVKVERLPAPPTFVERELKEPC